MADKPLSVQEIKQLADDYRSYYRNLRTQQADDEQFYEGTNDLGVSEPYRALHMNKARLAVDGVVDHIVTENPVVTRRPLKGTQEAKTEADQIEMWANAFVRQIVLQESPNPFKMFVKFLALRGEAVWKAHYDDVSAAQLTEPVRKKGEKKAAYDSRYEVWRADTANILPAIILCRDPMQVYCHPEHRRGVPYDVVETFKRRVWDIKLHWPEWKPEETLADNAEVDWIEYWHRDWRCFIAGGVPVLPDEVQPNVYGFVPYVHAFSGYGLLTAEGKPEQLARSCFYGDREALLALDRRMSQLDSIVALFAFHQVIAETKELARWLSEQNWGGGGIIEVPDGALREGRFLVRQGESPPPGLFNSIEMLERRLNESLPSVVRGEAPRGVEAGYPMALLVGQARLKYGCVLSATNHATAAALGQCLRLYETLYKQPITLTGTSAEGKGASMETLDPAILRGDYNLSVTMEASDPEANDRKKLLGAQLHRAGSIPRRHELELYHQVPDATLMMAERMAEDIWQNSPILRRALELQQMERMGLGKYIAQTEEAMKMEQPPATGATPPGVPPTPAMPESALELAQTFRRLGAPGQGGPLESPLERV